MSETQSPFKLWLVRKKRLLIGIAFSLVVLFGVVFYLTFWRAPLQSGVILPKGAQVMLSRGGFVMVSGHSFYVRAWCPGSAKSVAISFASDLNKMPFTPSDPEIKRPLIKPNTLPSNKIYKMVREDMEGILLPVYIGPPQPTSEGYDLSYSDGSEHCTTSVTIWPDGQNSQIEMDEYCSD